MLQSTFFNVDEIKQKINKTNKQKLKYSFLYEEALK